MSGMSTLWSNFGLGSSPSVAKSEKARIQFVTDLKYLYSAFTKIPCLRLSPDHQARLIGGYEEFPFDTAVPLLGFKNVSALEICDVDFRQFYGWDKLAEQLRSLTVKRSQLEDPTDLIINIVLDDMDRRRRRSSRAQSSPVLPWPTSPSLRFGDMGKTCTTPSSPMADDKYGRSASPKHALSFTPEFESLAPRAKKRTKSASPSRPSSSQQDGIHRHVRATPMKIQRSGSASSNSSTHSSGPLRSGSSSNLLSVGMLPASKWRFLRHLSLADNSLTSIMASSFTPLSNTLHSLDLSSNLFAEIPDCLVNMAALRALNLSSCMIESLHSLTRSPLPAVTALNLRANRLISIAGVERLLSLQRLDLRDNKLQDPTEIARLTGMPGIHEIWVLRNPFVNSHSSYRVTIFNLFRNTPGYSEDILIDGSSPGYSERRHLRDRVLEPDGVPVIKPMPVEPPISFESKATEDPNAAVDGDFENRTRPSPPQATQSEITVGSGRRKRGPRRRIVDLAQDDSPPPIDDQQSQIETPQTVSRPVPIRLFTEDVSPRTQPILLPTPEVSASPLDPRLHQTMNSFNTSLQYVSDKGRSLAIEIKSSNLDGEAYRQKIEALKNEVGNNWLSVLSEERRTHHQTIPVPPSQCDHVRMMRPELVPLRASTGIVGGSRTLG